MNAIPGDNRFPSCHRGLENLDEEHDYWIDAVSYTHLRAHET